MNSNIQSWELSTNLFEWGVKCVELSTNSKQVSGVSPVISVSFAWNTVQPEISASLTANTTKRTYGIGQCSFEMLGESNRCKIQDAFKSQTAIDTLELIRFINLNKQSVESEKYVFKKVFIVSYSVKNTSTGGGHIDLIKINSLEEPSYIQTMRDEDGRALGQIVSKSPS